MLQAAREIREECRGLDRDAFAQDRTRHYAVYYLFTTIGEAARRLSVEMRSTYPELPWHQMIGMRNRLIHEYGRVDAGLVWETAERDIPPLIDTLERVLTRWNADHEAPDATG